jgi:hypothetical protein
MPPPPRTEQNRTETIIDAVLQQYIHLQLAHTADNFFNAIYAREYQ